MLKTMPSATKGWENKYVLTRCDGGQINAGAKFFVLKLTISKGDGRIDKAHARASQRAAEEYALGLLEEEHGRATALLELLKQLRLTRNHAKLKDTSTFTTRFFIKKTTGEAPEDATAIYLPLPLNDDCGFKAHHIEAAKRALKVYAGMIQPDIPLLASDIFHRLRTDNF